MTLRRRIHLIVLGSVVAAFVIAGSIIGVAARNHLIGQVDEHAGAAAEAFANAGGLLGPQGLADSVRDVSRVTGRPDVTVVLDGDGEELLSLASRRDGRDDPLPDLADRDLEALRAQAGEPFTADAVSGSLRYRVVTEPLGEGVVIVATPLDEVRDTLRDLVGVMAASAAAVVVVLSGVAALAARRAVRPVNQMIATAQAIGAGDLGQRIPEFADLPETRQLGDALNNMLGQLERAFADKDASQERLRRFVADASHELRTPLTSIRGYADLYLTGAATDVEATNKGMQRIRSEAVRTSELVNDLLLLASLDQGRALASDHVDLSRIVADSIADLRAVQPARTIHADVEDGVFVLGDDPRLRQAIANLLANTRTHAGDSSVEVQLTANDHTALLVVSDHGPGMGPEEAAQVFDRFWRASRARDRRTGGTGLGLSIVDSVVRAHDGTIAVDSAPGQGATFSVALPLAPTPRTIPDDQTARQ